MNPKPSVEPQPPDDDLPPHLASPEALARWNAEHPEEAKRVEEWMRRLAAGELGDATPEMREAAAKFVRSQVGHRSLTMVQAKFRALAELAARPGGTMIAEERLAQMNQLMDEIVDGLLDTPEPYRMPMLKDIAELREQVRQIKIEE